MQRVTRSTSVLALPNPPAGGTPGFFAAPNPAGGVAATQPGYEWFNAIQEEVVALATMAGAALDPAVNTQMRDAITSLLNAKADLAAMQAQTYTAFTSTGVTGAFVLTPAPAIAGYAANQRFRVKFHAVGNGADTINVSAKGAKALEQYDSTGAKVAAVIAAGQLVDVEYDGVDFVLLDALPKAPDLGIGYMLVRDEKAVNTAGGSSVAGNQTRTLNTVLANTISGASLASNIITLPPGTYRISARAPYFGNSHKIYLYDSTAGTVIDDGTTENGLLGAADPITTWSALTVRVTFTGVKGIKITHDTETAIATIGLGQATSFGTKSVYTSIEIIKES